MIRYKAQVINGNATFWFMDYGVIVVCNTSNIKDAVDTAIEELKDLL